MTIFIPIAVSTVVVLDESFVAVVDMIFGVIAVVLDAVVDVIVFVVSVAVGTVVVVDARKIYIKIHFIEDNAKYHIQIYISTKLIV